MIGAAGGTKITTATAQAIVNNQFLGNNLKEAIDRRRVHHQLMPMEVSYEKDLDQVRTESPSNHWTFMYQEIVAGLSERGHKAVLMNAFGSVVVGVQKEEEMITANSDFRKSGAVAGF